MPTNQSQQYPLQLLHIFNFVPQRFPASRILQVDADVKPLEMIPKLL